MKKKSSKVIIAVLGIIVLILITVGVTYAVFTYTKLGTTENIIKAGTLDFIYKENTGVGRGISMTNALPVSDETGKSYTAEGQVFDFSVEGNNGSNDPIPYEITLRQNGSSTLPNDVVKVYLTDRSSSEESELVEPTFYSALNQTSIDVDENIEKTIYQEIVEAKDKDYKKDFRLRMWVDENTNFSAVGEDENGNLIYPYNNKTFTITVNVYSNEDIEVTTNNSYKEALLNGADPVIGEGMVPVKIDNTGKVTKADTTKEWYKYENKEWANAVITRNSYDVLNTKGKVNGATLNDGYVSFDGTDDYIDLGLANYDFGNSITIVTRFRYNDTSTLTQHVLGNWEGAGTGFSIGTTSKLNAAIYIEENNNYINIGSKNALEKGVYYTAVATYDGTTFSLYVDGVLNGSLESNGTIKESLINFYLGTNSNGTNNSEFFNGDITEAAIFTRAMTAEEVSKYFKDDVKVFEEDTLLSYVDFTNEVPENGEVIIEDNIESYFVWIPRYKYKIFDEGNYTGLTQIESKEQTIEVMFENKNITPSNGQTKGSYLTHPAFTSFDSNGMWVGKFETGYDGATTRAEASNDIVSTNKIIIKPNVYSWQTITIGNAFKNSYDYIRKLDSHMVKNTEWGAVAYLSHSKYGINKEIRVNNNGYSVTGYSATEAPTESYNGGHSIEGNRLENIELGVDGTYTINYLNPNSVVSSTTGNYTGIYDMSGGASDYVMAYAINGTVDNSGITDLYEDFFNDITYTKYWDKYTTTVNTNFSNRILGDATGEMGPFMTETDIDGNKRNKSSWYRDFSYFLSTSVPWTSRGSHSSNGTGAGIFAFRALYAGDARLSITYRIVLTPQGGGI